MRGGEGGEIATAHWTFAGYVGDAWTSSSTMTVVNAAARPSDHSRPAVFITSAKISSE
jgi:hypothetical protein